MVDTIKFLKTRIVKSPNRANNFDAGIDFYIPEFTPDFLQAIIDKNPDIHINENNINIYPGKRILIPSGIHCQMSNPGRALIAFNKSGICTKYGLIVGACVVDFEYQGEIHLSLINTSNDIIQIHPNMKILQFIEIPIFNSNISIDETSQLNQFYQQDSSRGDGGFGSSG